MITFPVQNVVENRESGNNSRIRIKNQINETTTSTVAEYIYSTQYFLESMSQRDNTLAITISMMGIGFLLHFNATNYYFWGNDPNGFSTGTLGLIFCLIGVLLAGYTSTKK